MSITKDDDFETRKKMYEDIKQFSRTEQEELYRTLRRCNEEMSENRNGIFFDLMSLKKSTIDEINTWITFCIKNRATFEDRERAMDELVQENFTA